MAFLGGVDDLIIDPTRWPTVGGLAGPALERLAVAWHAAAQRPRTVVFARRTPTSGRAIRRFLTMLPATWRDAPHHDPLALSHATPSVHFDALPQPDRVDALLSEATKAPALWTPKRIAAQLGCSEKTVNRHLAMTNRPSLASILRSARLARAQALVRARAGTMHEIAAQCGWSDVRSLRRAIGHARMNPPGPDKHAVHDWRLPRADPG